MQRIKRHHTFPITEAAQGNIRFVRISNVAHLWLGKLYVTMVNLKSDLFLTAA
jgi:hypothetical protein